MDVELLKAQLGEKEEKLSALFKTTSKIVTDYDGKTKRIIQTLHERRDEQVYLYLVKYQHFLFGIVTLCSVIVLQNSIHYI